jgi:hypothetical protein
MRIETLKNSVYLEIFYKLVLSVIVILICFPPVELTYTIGIDPPLAWVYNHFLKNGFENARAIIFAQGPLSFFMYPLQDNFILVLIVTTLLQLGIIFNLFSLTAHMNSKNWLLTFLISIILFKLLNFSLLILTNISLLYLLHYQSNNKIYKYIGLVLTSFAFYVKIQAAVISIAITASFLIIELVRHRKYLLFIQDIIIQFLLIFLIWLFMFKSLRYFFPYIYGMLNLAADNSAAVSLYPHNNWIYLIIYILTIVMVPFLQKDRSAYYFGFLFILSLFAAWKHGMAREDISHARNLFLYTFMLMTLFVLFSKKHLPANIIFISIGLLAFYLNLKNLPSYHSTRVEFLGVNNFSDFVTRYSSIKENANRKIENNLISNRLPRTVLEDIAESKVDVYPWDYSVIPANNLNWQPRPVIQSFLSYTSWLDKRNARHFSSEARPEFIIWDQDKITSDLNGGSSESIDNRYLLNDEPQTLLQILKHYRYHFKNSSFLILKKTDEPLNHDVHIAGPISSQWDTWISVPEKNGDLVRAKIVIKKNFSGMIKSFFYKDEASWIYYKLTSGEVFKYKIVPKNAKDGLWINPFILKPELKVLYPEVESIMLKNSNTKVMSDKILVNWEIFDFENTKDSLVYSFFHQTLPLKQNEILKVINTFEAADSSWSNQFQDHYISNCYQGTTSYSVASNSFSPTYSLNLDTIHTDSLLIQTSCWIRGSDSDIKFIISVESRNKFIAYDAMDLDKQIIENTSWNHVYNYLYYEHPADFQNAIMKVYIWNRSKNNILVDDFMISLKMQQSVTN